MATFNFITIRLGKDSVPDILKIYSSIQGILDNTFTINVKCTQVPDNYNKGDYAFIWLGSDNNKRMPTKWKQGFKAVGRVKGILRGKNYNDTSETEVEIVYIFHDSVNRMDILRCAPIAYYWCSSMPLIGLDDHANQTIRNMSGSTFADIRAFFSSIESVTNRFKNDIIQVEPQFNEFFDICLPDPKKYPLAKNLDELPIVNNIGSKRESLQQIYYGAPGTGKSHEIKKKTEGKEVIRTTFHPDSDYSTFVGAYKPTTIEVPMRDVTGKVIVENGKQVTENRIVYEFVEQAFLQAYIKAWKQYAKAEEGKAAEEVYLVIEEINRGNCAQIFGDLFQLLDRGEDGFSEYPIVADKDLQKQLAKTFADMPFLNAPAVCGMSAEEVAVKIRKGEILLLPNNLYIWATMNTSDQSLFPIDSAFKRRWDWQYMPIANGTKGWRISANGNEYDWWEFLEKINALIGEKTCSEDKKLGYFFCKTKNGVIDAKMFVGKVIFYLWNDVFKDYEFEGDAFNDVEGKLTFDKFYKTVDGTTSVVAEKVMLFLKNLEVVPVVENEDEDIENVDDPDSAEGKDYTRYTINGEGNYPKRQLSTQAVRKYIELHPELTPEQVVADWMSLGSIVSHFVETKEQFDARTDNSKRSHEVPCGDTKIYVAWNGWGIGSKMQTLITAVNSKDWGITLAIKE